MEIIIHESRVLQKARWESGWPRAALAEYVGREVIQILPQRGVLVLAANALDKVVRQDHVREAVAKLDGMASRHFCGVVLQLQQVLNRAAGFSRAGPNL